MFYCDNCANKNEWPPGFMRSFGPCEVCGRKAHCNDMPSYLLPDKKDDKA